MKKTGLCLTAVGSLLLLIMTPWSATAQTPVKMGFVYVFSERQAHYGFGAKQGAEMAIEEINKAGGINGRQIVSVYEDTKLKPDVGVQAVRKLINEDQVDVVVGLVSSGVASAVAPLVNDLKTPLIITLAMTPDVTGKICNPYTFRISINGPQNIKGAATLASQTPARRWTTMAPDYLFGYQCWEYFQRFLKDMSPDAVFFGDDKTVYASMDVQDFRPYIEKLMATNPEGVLVSLYGGNLVDFIRQGNELGLFSKNITFIMNLAYSADVMHGLGLDMPKGLWLGGLYWFQCNSTPENKAFVDAYMAKHRVFRDHNAHGGYVGVKTYAAACRLAGSTAKEDVIKVLPGLTLDIPAGKMLIRPEDHQAVYDTVWGMTSGQLDSKLRIRQLQPLKIFPGPEVTLPAEATGCRLP